MGTAGPAGEYRRKIEMTEPQAAQIGQRLARRFKSELRPELESIDGPQRNAHTTNAGRSVGVEEIMCRELSQLDLGRLRLQGLHRGTARDLPVCFRSQCTYHQQTHDALQQSTAGNSVRDEGGH